MPDRAPIDERAEDKTPTLAPPAPPAQRSRPARRTPPAAPRGTPPALASLSGTILIIPCDLPRDE